MESPRSEEMVYEAPATETLILEDALVPVCTSAPDFRHYGGNTGHRNHVGHGNGGRFNFLYKD